MKQVRVTKKVAIGLVAIAIAAAGGDAGAANYTWKGGVSNPSRAWLTASNWSQTASPAVVPPSNSGVEIGSINGGTFAVPVQRTINVTSNTNAVQNLLFTNNFAGYSFIGGGAVVMSPGGSIVNNSTTTTTGGTGEASVILRNVVLNGNATLGGTGTATEIFLTIESDDPTITRTLTVSSNNLILQGTGVNVDLVVNTGAAVSLDTSPSFLNVTVGSGGNLGGLPNRPVDTFFAASGTGALEIQAGSQSFFGVKNDVNYDQFATSGNVAFGGDLYIDWTQVGSTTFSSFTTFNLFDGSTYTGNFSDVLLSANVGPYAGLGFTQFGTEWSTAPFVGQSGQSQWLVFQAQSGNLVVVPEPSTIVFAGLGVAMSGWTMWKRRRLSKLLAR